jgi:hypothetical protein
VFDKTLGARVGARAFAQRTDFHLPSPRDIAQVALAVLGLAAAAVLFFVWLMLSESRQSGIAGSGPGSDCASLGRGGAYCAKHPASDARSEAGVGQDGDCASLGKGGRICAERPMNEDHSNK